MPLRQTRSAAGPREAANHARQRVARGGVVDESALATIRIWPAVMSVGAVLWEHPCGNVRTISTALGPRRRPEDERSQAARLDADLIPAERLSMPPIQPGHPASDADHLDN